MDCHYFSSFIDESVLMVACYEGHLPTIRWLLEHGANVAYTRGIKSAHVMAHNTLKQKRKDRILALLDEHAGGGRSFASALFGGETLACSYPACSAVGVPLKACARCHERCNRRGDSGRSVARYCGAECQRAHWRAEHKRECAAAEDDD